MLVDEAEFDEELLTEERLFWCAKIHSAVQETLAKALAAKEWQLLV